MYQFRRNTAAVVFVLALSAGSPVTGLVSGDFTTRASKNGAAASSVTPTTVLEVSAANMPGVYAFTIPAATFDTDGPIVLQMASGSSDTYSILGQVGVIDWMLDMRGLLQAGLRISSPTFDAFGNMLTATLEAFDPGADPSMDTPRVTLEMTSTYNAAGRLTEMVVEEA